MILEFTISSGAVFLLYAIKPYRAFDFHKTLSFGYFLLFISYFVDSIDQVFIHSIIYTVVMEKATLIVAAVFIYIGSNKWMESFKAMLLTDDLTNIPNRKLCREVITNDLIASQKLKLPLCLAMVDIDFFKRVNDKHGHNIGDKVLQSFAKLLTQQVRGHDCVGRWGGEEFLILLKGADLEKALNSMDRLKVKVSQHDFVFEEVKINITLSIGVSQMTREDDFDSLFIKADKALYDAKSVGRNNVQPVL